MAVPVLGPCLQKGVLSEEGALWVDTCHSVACDPSDRHPCWSGCGHLLGDSTATKNLISEAGHVQEALAVTLAVCTVTRGEASS